MANDFTTPGMARVNLGMEQWKSGKNFRQFIEDLNQYNIGKSGSESSYGLLGEAIGALGFLVNPYVGLATSLLGGWGGRKYGTDRYSDAPTREDYDIMFGEGALQDVESQLALDEEQYSSMNQFLKSAGVTANVLMSLYGPQFLKKFLPGGQAAAGTTDFATYGKSFSLTGGPQDAFSGFRLPKIPKKIY